MSEGTNLERMRTLESTIKKIADGLGVDVPPLDHSDPLTKTATGIMILANRHRHERMRREIEALDWELEAE